jgi:hypothetical protein
MLSSYFSVVRFVGLKRTTMLMARSSLLGVERTLSGIGWRSTLPPSCMVEAICQT